MFSATQCTAAARGCFRGLFSPTAAGALKTEKPIPGEPEEATHGEVAPHLISSMTAKAPTQEKTPPGKLGATNGETAHRSPMVECIENGGPSFINGGTLQNKIIDS